MNDDLKGSLFCEKVHVASGDSKIGKWEKLSNCNKSIIAFWCGGSDGHGVGGASLSRWVADVAES